LKGIEPAVCNEDIVEKWRSLVNEDRMRRIQECVLGIEKEDAVGVVDCLRERLEGLLRLNLRCVR